MPNSIKLTISYDGTDFVGWQIQKRGRSVQGEIEKALKTIHKREVALVGAGRTDSGVHATGQVAHFSTELSIPSEKFRDALNRSLPGDIRILKSESVPDTFHARFSALKRVYHYQIYNGEVTPAHLRRYAFLVRKPLTIGKLNQLAHPFYGTHDFTTFSADHDETRSKVRSIYSASFFCEGPLLIFRVVGNGFLRRMVRSLIGTILHYYNEEEGEQIIRECLAQKDRSYAGTTAPAWGLFLNEVLY